LAAAELHEALADPEPAVRLTGLELAAERDDIAVEKIAALLDDEDSGVVEAAAWACGEKVSAGHQQDRDSAGATLAALSRLALQHRDLLCRESAIAALGAISDPAGLPAILAGLDDKPEVRRRAVVALAPFEGPEVEAALHKAGSDRDRQVRAAAAELLSL
ncbi:MAG: HEAT repeat domain-containing protein, partial [Acidimicrobiaceae bacterium]|nr:HEAT repeat domain-containing protein [Acidimicrobiaceae bacterium]